MHPAITHYPIKRSQHLTISTALGPATYLSGFSVGFNSWTALHNLMASNSCYPSRDRGELAFCLRGRCCQSLAGWFQFWSLTATAQHAKYLVHYNTQRRANHLKGLQIVLFKPLVDNSLHIISFVVVTPLLKLSFMTVDTTLKPPLLFLNSVLGLSPPCPAPSLNWHNTTHPNPNQLIQ